MRKLLKNNKGMTLAELIVSMMVFSLVITIASAVLIPVLRSFNKSNETAELNTLLDNIANQIIGDLTSATAAPNFAQVDGRGTMAITVFNPDDVMYSIGTGDDNGVLLRNGAPVFSKIFYRNKSVDFSLDADPFAGLDPDDVTANPEDSIYILTVFLISDPDNEAFINVQRNYAVRPLALNQN